MENDLEYFENISDRFLLQFLYHIIYISGDNNPVLKYLAKFVLPGIKVSRNSTGSEQILTSFEKTA